MKAVTLQLLRMIGNDREMRERICRENGDDEMVTRSPADGFMVLAEKLGEVANAIAEEDEETAVEELVAAAALLVAMAEAAVTRRGTKLESLREDVSVTPAPAAPGEVLEVWEVIDRGGSIQAFPHRFFLRYESVAQSEYSASHAAALAMDVCGVSVRLVDRQEGRPA